MRVDHDLIDEDRKVQLNTGRLLRREASRQANSGSRGVRREYVCRFIRAGRVRAGGNQPSRIEIPAEAIRTALQAGQFEGKASFLDHADWFAYPSLRDLVGVTLHAYWNEATQSADGVIRLYEGPAAEALRQILDGMLKDGQAGDPAPDVGLSLVFWPEWAPVQETVDAEETLRLKSFRHIESVDFVFEPAADGRVKEALQALAASRAVGCPASSAVEELRPYRGAAHNPTGTQPVNLSGGANVEREETMNQTPRNGGNPPEEAATSEAAQAESWMRALSAASSGAMIANSGLPAASRERLARQRFASPEEVEAAIEQERGYLARLAEDSVVQLGGVAPRSPQISLGLSGIEQLQLAADALLSGMRPRQGVPPLTGVRELYNLLSGDYEMTGIFHPDRVRFANVNSATMAGMVANALNKRVVNLFQEYPRWWEAISQIEDFSSLQQAKWITLGGVGELPTVAEGAAYAELSWDDLTETADFVKKGGYLGLTIEAIDKDDTRKLQAAPRALAQAAWLTLSKAISNIFTANSGVGPTMSDGVALFNAAHGNLATAALSFTAWTATRTAMRKQTELNSGERLGGLTAPRFLVVPPDLEISALQILASEGQPGTANNDENPFAEGDYHDARLNAARQRVVVVDLWTDANNWAAVADPRLYPTIGVGFRYGRAPEIFSVASPTAGLMFSNDTLPIKVRFLFAAGPMDYRGLYKANVA